MSATPSERLPVIGLTLPDGPLRVVAVGAHPDDVEIGCGGTLLTLQDRPGTHATVVVASGSPSRHDEARTAASGFLGDALRQVHLWDFPDGYLPGCWAQVKRRLATVARQSPADLVLVPRRDDAHQDHRLLAEMAPTVWRDSLVLHYEIPKWDGDLGRVTHYVALAEHHAERKVGLLNEAFPSQAGRDWWDDETFLGLLRLRGVECRTRYAEGFVVGKALVSLDGHNGVSSPASTSR